MAETEIKKINGRTVCDQTARDSIPKSASDIGADPAGTGASKVNAHNISLVAHSDIRVTLQSLVDQVNSFLNVDDATRNELSEVLALIDSNKDLIEEITIKKVNVTDIINNLSTNVSNKPLSAAQGVVLKELIDTLQTAVDNISVPTKLSDLAEDSTHRTVTDEEKDSWNQKVSGEYDSSTKTLKLFGGGYELILDCPSEETAENILFNLARKEDVEQLSKEIVDLQGGIAGLQPAGNYLTEVPAEYVTEDELEAEIADLKAQGVQQTLLFAQGNTTAEAIEWLKNNGDTSKSYIVPDETDPEKGWFYAYMKTEVTKEPTNLLPLATDTDRKTVYNGKGFKENTRLSGSSGSTGDATGVYATGFIPAVAGDKLYWEGLSWGNSSQQTYIIAYNSSNTVTGKLTVTGSTTYPVPSIPLTLDAATFGSGFNAIRISASGISTDAVITINEGLEGGTTIDYGWANTGRAIIHTDNEDRIIQCEDKIEELEERMEESVNVGSIPLVKFDFDHELHDVSDMVSNFKVASHDLRMQQTVPTVYSLFDGLVSAYPNYVTRVDAAEAVGLTYPTYANGITTAGTYLVTPAYKTYMYKLSYSNAPSGNESRHKHKKMLLIGGLDGSEYIPPYNLYILAKRLCEDFLTDSNIFKLRNAFDIYIVPCLNGYGLYHGTKYNANGIAITRNMPTKAWVEADADDPNYYTGSVAGSEFETQIVMKLTQYLNPDLAIDHHSYGYLPTQFYSELPREEFVRLAYQSLVDCSLAFAKNLPQYYGTDFKLFQYSAGATCAPLQVANVRGTQTWWNENGVPFGGLIEASVSINYLNGEIAGTGQDLYGNDAFSVAEYTLRNQLLRYGQYVLDLN